MRALSDLRLFSGRSHPQLAREIARHLGVELSKVQIEQFPDDEIGVQVLENVRGRDVFVVQSVVRNPNLYLMELLILVDALKRASAHSIVAVIPYYGYARQDRKDKGRVPITAKLVANLLEKAGVTRVLTMDLHTEQIQGFFDIPVDNLYARPVLVKQVREMGLQSAVVVTPDVGSIRLAQQFAADLKTDLAIVDKRRISSSEVRSGALIGEVAGRDVLLVDDMCSTGGTLKAAAQVCQMAGAKRVFAIVTHGLMSGNPMKGSCIEQLLATTTVPADADEDQITRVSIAPLFAEAIKSIIEDRSISSLFRSM